MASKLENYLYKILLTIYQLLNSLMIFIIAIKKRFEVRFIFVNKYFSNFLTID